VLVSFIAKEVSDAIKNMLIESEERITKHKGIEKALRIASDELEAQSRLYDGITGGTPDLVYVFDLNYKFVYANLALLKMWGRSWEESKGLGLLALGYEPWHAEMHEREIDEVVATKKNIHGEVSFPHATLGKRIYDYIFAPILSENGEVELIAGTTRDILRS
jgi:PAS domain S-box-containing protein